MGHDAKTVTGKNIRNIENEFNMNVWKASSKQLKHIYPKREIPEDCSWKIPLVSEMLLERLEIVENGALDEINSFIEIICTL